jgi:hypothetical protein
VKLTPDEIYNQFVRQSREVMVGDPQLKEMEARGL